jgi:membrane-associated phospholipid phosphatase
MSLTKYTWQPNSNYPEIYILIAITCMLLLGKPLLLSGYIVGIILNVIINIILKRWIAEPRPILNNDEFKLRMKTPENIPTDYFGMPSGHAQLFSFTFIYLLLSTHRLYIWLISGFITVIACLHRVLTMAHTALQVIVGCCIGVIMAYLVYNVVVNLIKLRYPHGVDPNNSFLGSIL